MLQGGERRKKKGSRTLHRTFHILIACMVEEYTLNNMSKTEPVEGNRKTTMKRDANRYGR